MFTLTAVLFIVVFIFSFLHIISQDFFTGIDTSVILCIGSLIALFLMGWGLYEGESRLKESLVLDGHAEYYRDEEDGKAWRIKVDSEKARAKRISEIKAELETLEAEKFIQNSVDAK